MTRATSKPLRRLVRGANEDLVVEVRVDTLTLRPKYARRGKAEIALRWGLVYQLGLLRRQR